MPLLSTVHISLLPGLLNVSHSLYDRPQILLFYTLISLDLCHYNQVFSYLCKCLLFQLPGPASFSVSVPCILFWLNCHLAGFLYEGLAKFFSNFTLRPISNKEKSQEREGRGVPGPTCRIKRTNQFWHRFSCFSVFADISVQVPAPCNRLGMQHTSHSIRAVSMPPTALLLQSLIIWEISRHAPRIFPSRDSTVAATDSPRPPDDKICPSHLNCSCNFVSKLPHISGSFFNSALTWVICFLDPITVQKVLSSFSVKFSVFYHSVYLLIG